MTEPLEPWHRAVLDGPSLPELLATAVAERGAEPYLDAGGTRLTFAEFAGRVADARARLAAMGVRAGDRVAVMLPNHVGHVVLVHALLALRAVWVPVNPRLRGTPLAHLLGDSEPALLVADPAYRPAVDALDLGGLRVVERLGEDTGTVPGVKYGADDVVAVMYTSGTTGPAKGVQVTDRMLRAAALGAAVVGDVGAGDVLFVWEPLCHVGGAQVLFVPFVRRASLALAERFSASAFWTQVRAAGATHVHHLGGIVSMLLSRPPSDAERAHRVRVCWGGGMTPGAWRAAEPRFGFGVRECYGMTEASSISTVNTTGAGDGIGRPVPWFGVEVHDDAGHRVPDGADGEIVLRPLVDGLLTPGYFRDDAATARSRRGPWWRTGDRGRVVDGALHFVGRLTDSVRHRGENVSAWEVETVVNAHPAVAESAVVGVPAAEGDEDVKVFVTLADAGAFDPAELVTWCRERLASYQVPRYVAVVGAFPKTPSLRVRKADLPRTTADCHDTWRVSRAS